jgi:hypothetical protein
VTRHANKPQVSQANASAVALRQLAQMNPAVHEFVVVSALYDRAPDRIYDARGNLMLCHADGVWIVRLHAPGQGGLINQNGYVLVNGRNGSVSSASTEATN